MHSIFFLTVGSLLLLYLGNDKTVLHFRFFPDHPLNGCARWWTCKRGTCTHLICRRPDWQRVAQSKPVQMLSCLIMSCCGARACSRTGRRLFWALLSAILSWWLIWSLKTVNVHGTESLWLVVSAVGPCFQAVLQFAHRLVASRRQTQSAGFLLSLCVQQGLLFAC